MNRKGLFLAILAIVLTATCLEFAAGGTPTFFTDSVPSAAYLNEDTAYHFDINASDPTDGHNATLIFTTTSNLFSINSATGVIDFTPTHAQVGIYNATTNKTVDFIVKDSLDNGALASWGFTILEVNDMPTITAGNITVNQGTYVGQDVNATDEEDGGENGNLTFFINDTTLFNISSTNGQFSFTPTNSHVGTRYINISVNDTQGGIKSVIISIEVVNVNDAPNLTWLCDNNRSATEDKQVTCYVNATDIDVGDTLTFSSNFSWFLMEGNAKALVGGAANSYVNFTPNDTAVGHHWINISVRDSSSGIDSEVISFNVTNVVDAPDMPDMSGGILIYSGVPFTYKVNATDNDTLTPDGDTIYFKDNTSLFDINLFSGDINFTALPADAGLHWVNISVNDSYGSCVSQIVNFTVISTTAPTITMITNQSATEGAEFFYNLSLNITDPDYNNTFIYEDNTSLFDIGSSTGIINFTANDSFVGVHWVNLTVTDAIGAKGSVIVNFTVFNVVDEPYFVNITNITAYEEVNYYYDVNATDGDIDIPSGNIFGILDYLTYDDNSTIFNITSSAGIINFTLTNQSSCGFYWVNISVNDTFGKVASMIISVNISERNDNPVLDHIGELNTTQGTYFFYDANATDEEDGGESSGNLTFFLNDTTMFNISSGTGQFNITPINSQVGIHYINFSVNDSQGGISSEIVKINVLNINDAPSIVSYIPIRENVSTLEDTNVTFVAQGSDADGDAMYYRWYDNGILRETDASLSGSESYEFDANYTSEGEHNITLALSDSLLYTFHFWNLTVNHSNAPVVFHTILPNITWVQSTSYSELDLDSYFRDIDRNDPLYNATWNVTGVHMNSSLDVINNSQISVSVDNTTNVVTLTPVSTWYGIEKIYFVVNDTFGSWALSNNITLNVSQVSIPSGGTTGGTSGSGGGGGGSSTRYQPLNIIYSGTLSVVSESSVITPLEIVNNGTKTLSGIRLKAISGVENITMYLDQSEITELLPGAGKKVNLNIMSTNLSAGRYELSVEAEVANPVLKDTVKFFIEVLREEEMEAKARKQLVFVHDFMKTNPECLELNEIFEKARAIFEKGDYAGALQLSDEVVNACKEIVRREKLPYVTEKRDLTSTLVVIGTFLMAFFIIIGIYGYFRRRKIKAGGFLKEKGKNW